MLQMVDIQKEIPIKSGFLLKKETGIFLMFYEQVSYEVHNRSLLGWVSD